MKKRNGNAAITAPPTAPIVTWQPRQTEGQYISKILEHLGRGDHAMLVANRLEASGAVGLREAPRFCPVATYLRQRGVKNPSVGKERANGVKLPDSVERFVAAFDIGAFSNLLRDR